MSLFHIRLKKIWSQPYLITKWFIWSLKKSVWLRFLLKDKWTHAVTLPKCLCKSKVILDKSDCQIYTSYRTKLTAIFLIKRAFMQFHMVNNKLCPYKYLKKKIRGITNHIFRECGTWLSEHSLSHFSGELQIIFINPSS